MMRFFAIFFLTIVIAVPSLSQNEIDGDTVDNVNSKKIVSEHSVYGELYGPGFTFSLGYTYTMKVSKYRINYSAGFGGVPVFRNPVTALVLAYGIDAEYSFINWLSLDVGIFNSFYFNYWTYFSSSGKDCSGMWLCPPDYGVVIAPFLGVNFRVKKFTFSPRFYGYFGEKNYIPFKFFPALTIKYKF